MKTVISTFLCLVSLTLFGQATKQINQYPNNPTPPPTFMILEDPGTGHYNQSTLGQIAAQFGGTSVSNGIVAYVNGAFVLNNNGNGTNETFWTSTTFSGIGGAIIGQPGTIFYGDGTGLSNVLSVAQVVTNNTFVTTNLTVYNSLTVYTNIYASTNFLTNIYVSLAYVTNLYSTTSIITNLYNTQAFITNLYATTNFSTNLYYISGKGNTLTITNVFIGAPGQIINSNITAASSIATWGANKDLTNGAVAARFAFTGNVLDLASGVVTPGTYRSVTVDTYGRTTSGTTPTTFSGYAISDSAANLFNALTTWDGSSWTNLTYKYTTNAVTGLALTFGKNYFTNVSTANITITAINATDVAAMETLCLRCTNSSGTSWTVTLPNGIGSPGLGLPPVITITNKQECRIYVQHDGNQSTNCWFIATY